MADWFSNFANQALQFADSITDTIISKANEAQQEILAEQNKLKSENEKKPTSSDVLLPWENDDDSRSIYSQELMESILSLSLSEKNFEIFPEGFDSKDFDLNAFVPIALKLLSLDNNLSRIHAKLMPHMEESDFWKNYYFRLKYLQLSCGYEKRSFNTTFNYSEDEKSSMIFPPDVTIKPMDIMKEIKEQKSSLSSNAGIASQPDEFMNSNKGDKDNSEPETPISMFPDLSSNSATSSTSSQQQKLKVLNDELSDEVNAELSSHHLSDLKLDDLDDLDGINIDDLDMKELDDDQIMDEILDDLLLEEDDDDDQPHTSTI